MLMVLEWNSFISQIVLGMQQIKFLHFELAQYTTSNK